MSWQIFGIIFYAYGLTIGLAITISVWLVQRKAQQINLKIDWPKLIAWEVLFAILGARIYHLITDYQLYANDLKAMFYIWNGGLSIIGAILAAILGLYLYGKITKEKINQKQLLDLAIYGLPIGQAIGRMGNYFNQELYGLPTNLFWKIYIEPDHRLPGLMNQSYYHPLFLYEAILMLLFSGYLWRLDHSGNRALKQVGTGRLFINYLLYYFSIRLILEFLRLEKRVIMGGLSINQLVMVGLIILVLIYQKKFYAKK